MADDRPPG